MDNGVVYVLKLEDDCYYVGFTTNLENRMREHFCRKKCSWLKLHKPIEIIHTISPADKFVEKEITLEYMKMKGWRKVRGASWSQALLKNCPKEIR